MTDSGLKLAFLQGKITMLEIACTKCPRFGRLNVARLIAERGVNTNLVQLKQDLSADCPRAQQQYPFNIDHCGSYYPQMRELQAKK